MVESTLSHEERYVGTTHHVDEFIGPELVQIAIRFMDPAELGFDTQRFEDDSASRTPRWGRLIRRRATPRGAVIRPCMTKRHEGH